MEAQTGFGALVTNVVRDEVARFVRERLAELSKPAADGGRKVNAKTKGVGQRWRTATGRRCTICGNRGHNARGHERAIAAQGILQDQASDETSQS